MRLAQNENPFFHRGPIRNRRYFFGRTEETREALQLMRNRQCVSIIGPWRIGKTSFLLHLCDSEVQKEFNVGEEYLFVPIDCQGLGNLDKSQFYQWLWEEVERALGKQGQAEIWIKGISTVDEALMQGTPGRKQLTGLRRELVELVDEGELRTLCFDLGVDYDSLPDEGKANKVRELITYLERRGDFSELLRVGQQLRPDIPWDEMLTVTIETSPATQSSSPQRLLSGFSEFREAMMAIQKRGYIPVFLFDEFETIAKNPKLDQSLFSELRGLVPILVYIIVSRDSLYDLAYADKSVLSSPFFNIFSEMRLSFLSPKEAKGMVSGLLSVVGQRDYFTEKDLTFAFEIGGYHPFFLQLACYYLFEQKAERAELTAEDYKAVQRQYAEDTKRFFLYTWDHYLEEEEWEFIRLVFEGEIDQLTDEQKRRLEKKCILCDNIIFSSVFTEFVQRQMSEVGTRKAHKTRDTLGGLRRVFAIFQVDRSRLLYWLRKVAVMLIVILFVPSTIFVWPDLPDLTMKLLGVENVTTMSLQGAEGEVLVKVYSPKLLFVGQTDFIEMQTYGPEQPEFQVTVGPDSPDVIVTEKKGAFEIKCKGTNANMLSRSELIDLEINAITPAGASTTAVVTVKTSYSLSLLARLGVLLTGCGLSVKKVWEWLRGMGKDKEITQL